MALATETLTCCLKSCPLQDNLQTQSRIDVKAFAPSKLGNFEIKWSSDGEATFHRGCWSDILRSNGASMGEEETLMVKEASQTAEYFDSPGLIEKEGEKIANLLKSSCHAIAFTGAGISTSAGVGDFRGKGGAWTERDRAEKYGQSKSVNKRTYFTYESLRPTYTHEAIAKLIHIGILKYVISQNVDGIHRLSGLPSDQISELHGNVFHEKCEKCGKRYERKYAETTKMSTNVPPKTCPTCHLTHRTGAVCEEEGCRGYLMNTIINFGDNLESPVISSADLNARANDVVLCLGSSLRVSPACDFVQMGNPIRIAICNRQPTPFDDMCTHNGSRVYGDCDDVMRVVMKHLLGETELKTWEDLREERMTQYALQRDI